MTTVKFAEILNSAGWTQTGSCNCGGGMLVFSNPSKPSYQIKINVQIDFFYAYCDAFCVKSHYLSQLANYLTTI